MGPEPHDSGIGSTGRHHRVGQHLLVVLPVNPALARNGRVIQKRKQSCSRVREGRQLLFIPFPQLLQVRRGLLQQGVLLNRRVISEGRRRHFRSHRTVVQHPHDRLLQNPTDHSRLQTPTAEALHQGLFATGLDHKQHPLLRLRQQELVGRHALFAGRNTIEIQFHTKPPFGGHLGTTAGQPRSPHVLRCDHIAAGEGLQTGFDQSLLQEGITHLNGRTIIQGIGTELSAGKAGAPHTVPAGGAAHVNDGIADALGTGFDDVLGLHQPEGHGIHQGVTGVGGVKGHLTPHGGHPDAIAVMGDAGHHSLNQAHIGRILQGTETQRVQQGDGPGPHREDVAQDSPHTRGRPLKRFNGGRVVVALDLEGESMALAQVHHTSIFAGTHENPRPFGGKTAQQRP